MDILSKEQVKIDRLFGHGGYFKTPVVGQSVMAAATGVPVSVMETAGEGGAHHTVLSTAVTGEMMEDWAAMMDIECVHITKDTTVEAFKKELFFNDIAWKLKML